jgi:hypothetical protein
MAFIKKLGFKPRASSTSKPKSFSQRAIANHTYV